MHLNKPAKDNSRDPSSLSPVAFPCKNPNSDFCLAVLFASSAAFLSSSSS